jgi:hypothetical protein
MHPKVLSLAYVPCSSVISGADYAGSILTLTSKLTVLGNKAASDALVATQIIRCNPILQRYSYLETYSDCLDLLLNISNCYNSDSNAN